MFSNTFKTEVLAKAVKRCDYRIWEERMRTNYVLKVASPEEIRELAFIGLARRLLQAKFYSIPAYSNAELATRLGVCSDTQLSALMQRKTYCTGSLFTLISDALKKIEDEETLPEIKHPQPEEWQS